MARTAVVAGTATAVAGRVRNSQANAAQAAQQQQPADQAVADQQAQQAPPTVPPAQSAGGDDLVAQLEKLAGLKSSGALDDAEFAAAKARLLAG